MMYNSPESRGSPATLPLASPPGDHLEHSWLRQHQIEEICQGKRLSNVGRKLEFTIIPMTSSSSILGAQWRRPMEVADGIDSSHPKEIKSGSFVLGQIARARQTTR